MFPHLLTWNPSDLVEMKNKKKTKNKKQNKLQILIKNPLGYKIFMKNALNIFFWCVCPTRGG